jgi:hypothetical protein
MHGRPKRVSRELLVKLADLRRRRYALLLALLLVSVALQSFTAHGGLGATFSDVFRAFLGIAILLVVFERSRERIVMALVLALAIIIGASAHSSDGSASLAFHLLLALFLWAAVAAILRDMFARPSIGVENVLGAICGYLVAGDAWAAVNASAYLVFPAAYSIDANVTALLADWHGRMALFAYYGFAQMLTIGYAEVTPIRAPATTLSLFAAIFGLFYTAVVVSQFVNLAQAAAKVPPRSSS